LHALIKRHRTVVKVKRVICILFDVGDIAWVQLKQFFLLLLLLRNYFPNRDLVNLAHQGVHPLQIVGLDWKFTDGHVVGIAGRARLHRVHARVNPPLEEVVGELLLHSLVKAN